MANIDWIAIKNEYINTNISYRKLSEKYNVSFATLQLKAKKECWKNEHDKQYDKTMTKIRQKTAAVIVKKEINRMERLTNVSDMLLEKVEQAANQLENYIVTNKIKIKTVEYDNKVIGKPQKETTTETENLAIVDGIIDKQGLKCLASALKDLKEIQTTLQSNQKQDPTETDPLTQSLQNLAKELSDD